MRDETTRTPAHPRESRADSAAAQHALRRWSATVLARLDAVVEEHGGAPARAAALDVVAATARERRSELAALRPWLEHPVLAPAWRRHCRLVALAAGEDVSSELTRLVAEAVDGPAQQARPERGTGCPALVLARRSLRLACARATGQQLEELQPHRVRQGV